MGAALVVVPQVATQRAPKREFGGKDDPAREFRFERVKEGLGARVIARPASARALCDAMACHERAERRAHVLGATIAVKDQSARRATPT